MAVNKASLIMAKDDMLLDAIIVASLAHFAKQCWSNPHAQNSKAQGQGHGYQGHVMESDQTDQGTWLQNPHQCVLTQVRAV